MLSLQFLHEVGFEFVEALTFFFGVVRGIWRWEACTGFCKPGVERGAEFGGALGMLGGEIGSK